MNLRTGWILPASLLVLAFIGIGSGCSLLKHTGHWRAPQLLTQLNSNELKRLSSQGPDTALAQAEAHYANALAAAEACDEQCVDFFVAAALAAWRAMDPQLTSCELESGRVHELYRAALLGVLKEGARHHRFDFRSGLRIRSGQNWCIIPLKYRGFPDGEREIDGLVAVGDYHTRQLNHLFRCPGIGLTTLAVHCRRPEERFVRAQQMFPATLVLRHAPNSGLGPEAPMLELYDSQVTSHIDNQGNSMPLARDLSAAIAYPLLNAQRNYLQEFFQPGQTSPENEGLFLARSYEPGKIPVVLSHGLISDRLTWANFANEFYARPHLTARFQLWGFEYATGNSFLSSAALLRRQLEEACQNCDPGGQDPALSQIVLVGHSMGGLVNKLQVASSGDGLWNAIANRPFDQVCMAPEARQRLADACFFEPSHRIARVVFMGTPHQGSAIAQRLIGRLGSLLVREPADQAAIHRQLIDENPGTFSREVCRRIPTSVDLLEPKSPLLQATNSMPIDPGVVTHSIIGTGKWMPGSGDSDGVVPVNSARFDRQGTEFYLRAKHTELTQEQTSIDELFRILEEHLQASGDPLFEPAHYGERRLGTLSRAPHFSADMVENNGRNAPRLRNGLSSDKPLPIANTNYAWRSVKHSSNQ